MNEVEKILTTGTISFAKVKSEHRYSWKDVIKGLKDDEAAIEMVRVTKWGHPYTLVDSSGSRLPSYPQFASTDTVYYVALITTRRSRAPAAVVMKNETEMERYANYYHNMMEAQDRDSLSYNIFWTPIQNKISTASRIYFSADGVYNSINLKTLYNRQSHKYLIDEKDIVNLTTTRDLASEKTFRSTGRHAILVGMPDYMLSKDSAQILMGTTVKSYYELPLDSTGPQRGFGDFDPLPGSKVEVERIDAILKKNNWATEVFLNQRATEEIVKTRSNPTVLHISTHGFFLKDEVDGLKLNPLVRSGVMLAGAQNTLDRNFDVVRPHQKEDGILTAYEVMSLNFDSTELVALSACETGLGTQRNGEGVYGLQRAIKVAGAQSVIMSLWKVDDNATMELMNNFYQEWANGSTKPKAFKKAELKVREKYKHPYYWGGFILIE